MHDILILHDMQVEMCALVGDRRAVRSLLSRWLDFWEAGRATWSWNFAVWAGTLERGNGWAEV